MTSNPQSSHFHVIGLVIGCVLISLTLYSYLNRVEQIKRIYDCEQEHQATCITITTVEKDGKLNYQTLPQK